MTAGTVGQYPPVNSPLANKGSGFVSRAHHLTWLVVFGAVCLMGIFSVAQGSAATFITFGLFLFVGLLISSWHGATPANLFLLVYSVCAIVALFIYGIYMDRYGVPYYVGGSDDLHYEVWAQATASRLGIFDYGAIRGNIVGPQHNSVGYVYLVSLLYRFGELLGGFHSMIPRLFNGMLLGITAVFSYTLAGRLGFPRQMALAVGLAVGLMPIMVYISVHTFRDVLVALLLLIGVFLWTPDLRSSRTGSGIVRWGTTLLLVLILSELRFLQSFILLAVAFVGDVFASQRVSPLRQRIYMFLAILAAMAMLFAFQGDVVKIVERLSDSQERYGEYRSELSGGLSTYIFTASPPLGYVLRMGYALITPLPVPSLEFDRLFLSAGTMLQFFFLPFLGIGILGMFKRRFAWPLLIAFLALFGGMAFLTFTVRHIVQFFPYGVILSVAGYQQYQRYRLSIWFLLAWLGVGLALVYLLLKYVL